MQILVLHGPNLNLFGRREPQIYGRTTLAQIDDRLAALAADLGVNLVTLQSNHEGELLDFLHRHMDSAQGALVNPAGLTQHGVPLHDAIKAMPFPVIEVHVSNIAARESWRGHSIISPAVRGTVQGLGIHSYLTALRGLVDLVREGTAAAAPAAPATASRTQESFMATDSATVVPAAAPVLLPVVGETRRFPVRRIYCVGRNYVEHAKEMGFTGREPPFFFQKPADAIVYVPEGETGHIPYPMATKDLHHEIELVAAIGKGGSRIKAADARNHVYGWAVGLDMTRRDLQGEAKKLGRPWEVGKAYDQSAPIGPIYPMDKVGWMDKGRIALEVNGKVRQQSDVDKLIWNVGEVIEHLSALWRLEPGDLIYTGTPEGVAAVGPGDLLVGMVEKVGGLKVEIDRE